MTPKEFAVALLQRLGAPVTTNNVAALVAFAAQEGGHYRNSARFNPLNTTRAVLGAQSLGPVGIKAFPSWDAGIEATAQTIEQQNMRPIWQALMADAAPEDTLRAVTATPWCPQSSPGCASYASRPASYYNSYANIADPVGGDSAYGYASITTSSTRGGALLASVKRSPGLTLLVAGGLIAAGLGVAWYLTKPGGLRLRLPSSLRWNPVARRPSRVRRHGHSRVQTLLFPRTSFTPSKATAWARSHGYNTPSPDVTTNYVRLRQSDPKRFTHMRTINLGKSGVKAVVGRPR